MILKLIASFIAGFVTLVLSAIFLTPFVPAFRGTEYGFGYEVSGTGYVFYAIISIIVGTIVFKSLSQKDK